MTSQITLEEYLRSRERMEVFTCGACICKKDD